MRSKHADDFNHDEEAADYDVDVTREAHPIRAGYDELLDWVVREAGVNADSRVLELGSGTGNLTARLPDWKTLVAVDVSAEMTKHARAKLVGRPAVDFVQSDMLGFFDVDRGLFDVVVSTYAVHHLLPQEKTELFRCIDRTLSPKGVMVFGDLMFESEEAQRLFVEECKDAEVVEAIHEEYFWNVEAACRDLAGLGFDTKTVQVSELSWGLVARAQTKRIRARSRVR